MSKAKELIDQTIQGSISEARTSQGRAAQGIHGSIEG